jgi:hypothetical protein
MYLLDPVYGPRTFRTFERNQAFPDGLASTRQTPQEISKDEPLLARRYAELMDIVSFLSVMNKRHTLYFRGQGSDWPLTPTIFRPSWTSLSGTRHDIPDTPEVRTRIWAHLNDEIRAIVYAVCDSLPMPRRATLKMFREAMWAVAQHYELWPTPLVDITPNLRIAASFALWEGRGHGLLYVVALPPSTNSVTYDADQHVALARLQAVCPPVAKRPHYQDGFLVGRFPFESPDANDIDRNPAKVSNLGRRLVAKIRLEDAAQDDVTSRGGFWCEDFPRMSTRSLLPEACDDELLARFLEHAPAINAAMAEICRG